MDWLEKKVKEASMKQLAACGVALIAVLFALGFNERYLRNYFAGPYSMPASELLAAADAETPPRYWVTLQPEAVFETGIEEITVRKKRGVERSRSVTGSYYVARFGERLLVVKAHESHGKNDVLTGELIASRGDVIENMLKDTKDAAGLRPRFLPLMLDTHDFQSSGTIGLWIAAIIATLAVLLGGFAAWRWRSPAGHASLKALSPQAQAATSAAIAADLQAPLGEARARKHGDYILTTTHLLKTKGLRFAAHDLQDLLWAYLQVTQNKVLYVIPTSKTYALKLSFSKVAVDITGSEAVCKEIIEHLARHTPWALFGYSDELSTAYSKRRAEVIGLVAERKAALASHAATSI